MSTEFNPDKYIEETINLFSGKSLSLEVIRQFIILENRHHLHKDIKYKESYQKIFTILRDNVILPNYKKFSLIPFFEDIASLYRLSPAKISPSDKVSYILTAIDSSYNANDAYNRLYLLRTIFYLKTFQGQDFRDDFIAGMSQIQSFRCFKSYGELKGFAAFLRYHYPDAKETMNILLKNVFNFRFADRDILSKKAGIMWVVEVIWNMVHKEDPAHMMLMDNWMEIFRKAVQDKDDELAFYMHFPISHLFLNNCSEQSCMKEFNDRLEMPFSEYVTSNMDRWGLKPVTQTNHGDRKRLAFVYDRLAGTSPVKLLISLLHYLKEDGRFDLYVYDMAYIEKSVSSQEYIDEVTGTGTKYISNHDLIDDADMLHYYSHFNKNIKLRERIIEDGIDVLIITSNRTQSNFLFSSRTAPLQIYWDHGNHGYNVHGIDKRICHFDDGYDGGYEVNRFILPMLDKYLNPHETENRVKAQAIKDTLPPHKIVLGSIGRLMKLSDEYLKTVADILKKHPEAVYLACGDGPIDEKRPKVESLGISDRFIFTGWVDPHIYGHVIDIYLNTFPLPGGESVAEFLKKASCKMLVSITGKDTDKFAVKATEMINMLSLLKSESDSNKPYISPAKRYIVICINNQFSTEISLYIDQFLRITDEYTFIVADENTANYETDASGTIHLAPERVPSLHSEPNIDGFLYSEDFLPDYMKCFNCQHLMIRHDIFDNITGHGYVTGRYKRQFAADPEKTFDDMQSHFTANGCDHIAQKMETLFSEYLNGQLDISDLFDQYFKGRMILLHSLAPSLFPDVSRHDEPALIFIIKRHIQLISQSSVCDNKYIFSERNRYQYSEVIKAFLKASGSNKKTEAH